MMVTTLLTDRAEYVIKEANKFAKEFDHEYIGTEHILAGLIREANGLAAVIMREKCSLATLQKWLKSHVTRGEPIVTGKRPYTPRAKLAIEKAIEFAREIGDAWANTEHLLVGLLRAADGVAVTILEQEGITESFVVQRVSEILEKPINPDRKIESRHLLTLLMRCGDSIHSLGGGDDLDIAAQAIHDAIRWVSEYRVRIQG